MEASSFEKINTLKSEHLKDDALHIMVCVGTPDDFRYDLSEMPDLFPGNHDKTDATDIDFKQDSVSLKEQGFKNAGEDTYVMSKIDSNNKFSKSHYDCTGLIVSGIEKNTGNNISFLSHQNPEQFLKEKKDSFVQDLEDRIREMKERCEIDTIDAVVYGGRYAHVRELPLGHVSREMYMKEYEDSIGLLTEEIKKGFGFEPVVVGGPKTNPGADNVFYNNEHRRLFLLRHMTRRDGPDFGESYMGGDLDKAKQKIKPGEWSLPL